MIYAWIHASADRLKPRTPWADVEAELVALVGLSLSFFPDLGLRWQSQTCMADASNHGYAAMSTEASAQSQRQEAR